MVAQSIIKSKAEDGCLLLCLDGNVLYSLNESALVVWAEIERHHDGMSREQIVSYLQFYYSGAVSKTRLLEDVRDLIERLSQRGFLTRVEVNGDEPKYRIKDDVFRTVADESYAAELDQPNSAMSYRPDQPPKVSPWRAIKDTCVGFIALLSYEFILMLGGFGRLCVRVERWPVAKRRKWSPVTIRQVCAGVDRARLWYPKKVLCLQHSAVITCLLRRQGVPARMMFAARRKPFYAHAWCEVGGTVVNDDQSVRTSYNHFRRCLGIQEAN